MPVEIAILSGARQGERIELAADTFRIGAERNCEVLFQPDRDPAILGHSATVQRAEDGWRIRNTGIGDVLVNHEPVFGGARLRNGDIIRMSERGPDLCFMIVSPGESAPAVLPAVVTMAADPTERTPETAPVSPVELDPLGSFMDGADLAAGPPLPKLLPARRGLPWAVWPALGALVLLAVAGIVVWQGSAGDGTTDPSVDENQPALVKHVPLPSKSVSQPALKPSAKQKQEPATKREPEPASESVEDPPAEPPDPVPPEKPAEAAGRADAWSAIERDAQRSVYLLLVEQPDRRFTYPFATAFAVGRNTLLTSAAVTSHLQNDFRAKGFQVWAKNEISGRRIEVVELDVHQGWLVAPDRRERVYFDLGGLRVKEDLPDVMRLATPDELAALATGEEVACVGIAHGGDPIQGDEANRFERLEPTATVGRILTVTRLASEPASPRLLHIKGPMPRNLYGSPIVNAAGRVVGIYSEAAAIPDEAELKLHYAPLLAPELVRVYLEGKGLDIWVPAGAPPVLKPLSPPMP